MSTLFVGLASSYYLYHSLKKHIEHGDRSKPLLVCNHSYSIGANGPSHNQSIEKIDAQSNREDFVHGRYDQKLAELVGIARKDGWTIEVFTQGSSFNGQKISRASGIKTDGKTLQDMNENDKLAYALESYFETHKEHRQLFMDNLTHTKHKASFLHDLKVYFVACCFDELKEQQIIKE